MRSFLHSLLVCSLLLLAGAAFAQAPTQPAPTQPAPAPAAPTQPAPAAESSSVLDYVAAFVTVALVLLVVCMPSRRE